MKKKCRRLGFTSKSFSFYAIITIDDCWHTGISLYHRTCSNTLESTLLPSLLRSNRYDKQTNSLSRFFQNGKAIYIRFRLFGVLSWRKIEYISCAWRRTTRILSQTAVRCTSHTKSFDGTIRTCIESIYIR